MTRLFAFAIFLSAALLLMVQPLAGKVLLPVLGGSPAVWSVCMVFFQGVLLLGYLYAHLLTTRVPGRWQGVVHVGLLAVAAVTLPVPTEIGAPEGSGPVWWVVRTLSITVGLPFFALSASAPLMQRWFSKTNDPAANDPYFLYAASNAGSLVGLLAFPLLAEPMLSRIGQSWMWSSGFWVLVPVVGVAAYTAWKHAAGAPVAASSATPAVEAAPIAPSRLALWVVLALVPSALLLGVTQHLATDVVSAPFMWAAPLAVYLVTFIAAFAKKPVWTATKWGKVAPWAAIAVGIMSLGVIRYPLVPVIISHIAAFGVLAMMCHARLAEDRPEPAHLTRFYLCISLGGALGGVATALVAPAIFNSILEYPLAIVAAVLLRPQTREADRAVVLPMNRWVWRVASVALALVGWWAIGAYDQAAQSGAVRGSAPFDWVFGITGDPGTTHLTLRALLIVPALALFLWPRAALPGLGAFAGVVLGAGVIRAGERSIYRERTFFGVHEVASVQNDNWHILNHGTTKHGIQAFKGDKRLLPTMYYHPSGPIGDVIAVLLREGRFQNVGVVGLGVGTLAGYADAGVAMDFFEIDPAVIRIAKEPAYFTYLSDAAARPGASVRTFEGDGRLALLARPEASYDLVVIDAFSSDAIPTHLITNEAVAMYVSRLKPRGVLAFHVSSRYFNLQPILARIAQEQGLAIRVREDTDIPPERAAEAKQASIWVVLSRSVADLGPLAQAAPRWTAPMPRHRTPLWTDDYSNVLGALEDW